MKALLVLLLAAVAAPRVQAELIFALDPTVETLVPGTFPFSVGFSGTLTDTEPGDVCDSSGFTAGCLNLNDISFTFDQNQAVSLLSADSNPFFNNIAGFLSGQDSSFNTVSGTVFGIIVDPATPFGTYTGTVSIIGEEGVAGDSSSNTVLATENWTLKVVPEPAPFGLALLGLASIALVRRVAA